MVERIEAAMTRQVANECYLPETNIKPSMGNPYIGILLPHGGFVLYPRLKYGPRQKIIVNNGLTFEGGGIEHDE